MPGSLAAALAIAVLQPIYLWMAGRVPILKGRNALQFLFSGIACVGLWITAVLLFPVCSPRGYAEATISLMALASSVLVYLELWGLISRGYTIGILLTLLNSVEPLSEREIANQYRGGKGLDWIMEHRLAGMLAAGMVRRDADRLVLTRGRGAGVVKLYEIAIRTLGLQRTG